MSSHVARAMTVGCKPTTMLWTPSSSAAEGGACVASYWLNRRIYTGLAKIKFIKEIVARDRERNDITVWNRALDFWTFTRS